MNKTHFVGTSTVVLAALMFVAASQAAQTAQTDDGKGRVTVKWTDPSRPGMVRVNLLTGSLSVRTHAGHDVIVQSSALGRAGSQAGILLDEQNNVLTVSSRGFLGSNIDIQVPAKTNLNLHNTNGGNIVVDNVDGDIEVVNDKGNVMLSNVAGSVIAHAMKGNLSATLRDVAPNKPLSFSSMNGDVTVTLPQAMKATVKIHSDKGVIHSDFDITLGTSRGGVITRTNKTITGAINGGGIDVEVRTLNGNVYLHKGK
jgi:hypothetical protein